MISARSPFCTNDCGDNVDGFADRYYNALVVTLIQPISREPTVACQRTEIPAGSQIHKITNFIAESHTHRDNPCFDIWQLKVCLLFQTFEVLQKTKNPKNVTLYVGGLGLGPLDVLTNSTSVTKPV